MSLFSGSAQSRSHSKNLVEFKAGKMTMKNNMVTPDKRKGLVYVYQADDGLTHFCWKDRGTGTVEDDLIVFPEDCVFQKVTQCKEGSRVFLLKFKASSRKLFFWIQEPKTDIDENLVERVNDALNNPSSAGSSRGLPSGNSANPSEQDMHSLLSSLNQSQLMQLIGGVNDLGGPSGLLAQLTQMAPGGAGGGGLLNSAARGTNDKTPSSGTVTGNGTATSAATTTPSAPKSDAKKDSAKPASGSSNSGAVQLEDLQKILSGMQQQGGASPAVDLTAGINSEFVKRITSCPKTVKKLMPLLPRFGLEDSNKGSGKTNEEDVAESLISPAFQHALSSFCSAFPSGQLGPLIAQFEFGKDAVQAAQSGNMEEFLNAVQKDAEKSGGSNPPASTEPAEDMNVD